MRVKSVAHVVLPASLLAIAWTAFAQTPGNSPEGKKAPSCPLFSSDSISSPAQAPFIKKDPSCLINVASSSLDEVSLIDVRERAEYLRFHIPRAVSVPTSALIAMPKNDKQKMVVYEAGKFRSDAYALCARLRRVGLNNFRVLDGGIAAWAQYRALPEKMALSQLSDHEVATALLDPGNSAVALTTSFGPILKAHGIKSRPTAVRTVLIGDASLAATELQLQMARPPTGGTVLFWQGSTQKLAQLLSNQLAQDQKRLAGPGQSKGCGAL